MGKRHDEHYADPGGVEPIHVMEDRVAHSYSGFDMCPPPSTCMLLAMAIKYIMRAGLKDGQPWKKDIEKAQNYLHRALTGKWIDDDSEEQED